MKTFKRALSVMLAAAMILTTCCFFNPTGILPTAEAAVSATDPEYNDLYFVVPEAIYLAPRYNAYKANTSSTFQWYVNNTLENDGSITLDTGESGTGKISFRYPTATDVKIKFKWQSEPGDEASISSSTITYGDGMERAPSSAGYNLSMVNGVGSTMIMWGNSPSMSASTSGVWICWMATFTDTADGVTKTVYAYTYVYKPYVAPIAVGIRGKNTRGSSGSWFFGAGTEHFASYISWISGVHGVASERDGASYPKASTNHGLLPFSSTGSGVECGNLNLTLGNYFQTTASNETPGNWFESSSSAVPDKSGFTKSSTESSHNSGDDYIMTFAYSSTGKLTVDNSRYSNLNQIPNLSVGLMVTDDEHSESGGAYFISNFNGHNDTFNSDYTDYHGTSNDSPRQKYWDPLYGNSSTQIAVMGNWNDQNYPEGEGVKFNEHWKKSIASNASGTSTYYIGTGYANHQNGDVIYDTAELRCNVNAFNRADLRDAYMRAMKTFAYNNEQLLNGSEAWRQFFELFCAVAKWLTKIDATYTSTLGYSSAGALANALRNKTNQIKSMSTTEYGRQEFTGTQYNIKVYEENGKWKLSPVNGKTQKQTASTFHRGARVAFTSEAPAGYSFAGYFTDVTKPNPEASTTAGSLTVNQPNTVVTTGECVIEHATVAANCTYYYVRNEYTISYDLDGGAMETGVTNPTTYNVESNAITLHNPVKTGYAFLGWTGSNGYSMQQTVTIPQGSTGNKTYKANWSAHTYTVNYDGNGASFGQTASSEHTFGVPRELNGNSFFRVTNITYHYNIAPSYYVEEVESAGFEFAGWNTDPDGNGTGFTNRQSVVDLTTGDSITLYAQWNAIQDTLPSPTWSGYGFVGWYTDPNCTNSSYFGAGGSAFVAETDLELYAKWAEHVYTVHYNGNGATSGATANSVHHVGQWEPLTINGFKREYTITFDPQGGTVSPASKKFVYDFKHWTHTETDKKPFYNVDDEVKDLTKTENSYELYAQWTPRDASVIPPEPVRAGYEFDQWYMDANFSEPMPQVYVPVENATLYAKWTPYEYTITFNFFGGMQTEMNYNIESNYTLPSSTRTGYIFGGWKPQTSEGNWDMERTYNVGTNVNGKYGSVTLDALWTPVDYTITFDLNYFNDPSLNSSEQKTFNIESTDTIGEPVYHGYTFEYWEVLETDGNWAATGSSYAASESLTGKYGNVSLRAHWSMATYTITFDTDGGDPVNQMTYMVNSTGSLPAATKNGYSFVGWKPEQSSGSWNADITYLADVTKLAGKYGSVTLVAQWSLAGYMITFDERGGEEIANLYYTTQSTATLQATTRTAFTFAGWKPKATVGSWDVATVYPAGTSLAGMYGAVTLIAQWTADTYTIHFDPNGGDNYPDPDNPDNVLEYTTESQEMLGAPTRAGYSFENWTVTVSDGNWGEVGTIYKEGMLLTYKYGNVSLEAQWKSNGFTISYDLGEGGRLPAGSSNPTSYTVDNPDFQLINPVWAGYEFVGWTGTDLTEPSIDVTIHQGSMGDREYTANWTPITYMLQYTLYGGSLGTDAQGNPITNPESYTVLSPRITLINPTRLGYEFAGWEGTDLDVASPVVTIPSGSIGDRNYRATWTEKVYTLTYNLGGGSIEEGHENPTSYTINSPLITLTNPTRTGYTFNGWTSDDMTIADPMRVRIPRGSTGEKEFTAQWTANGYTITYDLQGGALPDGTSNPETYDVETPTFTLNNPEKDGYEFAGWTGSNGAALQTTVYVIQGSTGNKSFIAQWTPKEYNLYYNLDNGQLSAANPQIYTIETETFTLNNPSKTGYAFAGWTLTGETEPQLTVTIPTGSTGNRSYTAHWMLYTYAITYNLTGGSLGTDNQGEPITNPETYTVETGDITLNNPEREGYDFAGWTGSNGSVPQTTVFIAQGSTTGDKTYTANWTPKVYTITYRQLFPNSTTPVVLEMVNETTYTIETPTFTLNNPTNDNYSFDGWTGSNGDELEPTVTIVQGTMGNLTFIAHWGTATAYDIHYFLNGGDEIKANPTKYTVNSVFQLNAPYKAGYTFTGWTGTDLPSSPDNNGNYTTEVIIANQSGERYYTAHWRANNYYVQFRPNGGSGSMPTQTYIYDADPYLLPANTFIKTGSEFIGWAFTETAETPDIYIGDPVQNLTTTPNGIVVLYAVWETNTCTLTFSGGVATTSNTYGATGGSVSPLTDVLFGEVVHLPKPGDPNWNNLRCDSTTVKAKRTFLGWTARSDSAVMYAPGDEFLCQGDETFDAVWSANYYALDRLVTTIERYRSDDLVPANENDAAYAQDGDYAYLFGSDGYYPWDNFDMSDVEAALEDANAPGMRDLPNGLQSRVNMARQNLDNALNSIKLLNADKDAQIDCLFYDSENAFCDEYDGTYYPPCGDDGEVHSYNALKATMDALFSANNANILYTADSVQALHDIIYGNGFDMIGIVSQVENSEFKMPAQGLLDEFTSDMARAYHETLVLKDADYSEFESLITDYLPSLHDDVTIGQGVNYSNLESFYTTDSVDEMKSYYEEYEYAPIKLKNVQQWQLEDGGDIYMTLRDLIDALVPVDANYMNVFYEILNIPTGTDGFEYPAPNATNAWLPTWMEWARDNAGDISSQMDTEYLSARYTEASLMTLYRVLDVINWDLNKFEQDQVDGTTNVTSYRSLLASAVDGLKLRKYTITYKYNDGTDASFTTQGDYTYGDRIGAFPTTDPRRTDYIFRGWSADPYDDTPVSVEEVVYGNMSLYAIWTSQFTITYELNGGEPPVIPNPTRYADTDPDIVLNNPTKAGYDFAGWTGSNGDVPDLMVVIISGSTGSKNFEAHWLPVEYAITYNLDGGSATNPLFYTIEDETFTLNNPTRGGYAFAGWTGTDLSTPTTEVSIAKGSMGDRSYTATWTAAGFTLTYDLAGGSLPEGVTNPTTYTIDTPTFTLNNPVRTGCTFEGWTEFEGAEPQETFRIVKGSTGNRTFTAHWIAQIYMITYDLAGGSLAEGVVNTDFYTVDSNTFMLTNPTRFGYDFAGWTGTGLEEPTVEVIVPTGSAGDREYIATWDATKYTIHYELDGGTSENPAYHTIEDDAITLQAPTKAGYDFNGWTGSNGSTQQTSVTIPAHTTGELNYTAHWTIVEYTLNYLLNGGSATNPATYTVASKPITLNRPLKRGYSFDGWMGTGLEELTKDVEIPTGSTGNRTYMANWSIVTYSIDYDLTGGELAAGVTNPDSFTVDSATFTLNNPDKEAYDFAGWTGTGLADPELVVTIDKGSITNRSYTANWTPTVYAITYDLAGGSLAQGFTNPETYTIETDTFALAVPTKSGCTFDGWTGSNGSVAQPMVLVNRGSTGDKSYTANWTVVEYTISYTLLGGTAENPTTYTVETETFTLNEPTKRGYTFTGWTGSNGRDPQKPITIVKGSIGNKNYTANWTATEYAIDIDLDGGAVATENPLTYTVDSEDITLVNPTKTGYNFLGWTGSNGTDPHKTVTIPSGSIGDKNYTANWDPIVYNISYTLNGGDATNPATYTIETETFTLAAPTKEGYSFAGWTINEGEEPQLTVTIEQGSIGDRSYTANWTTAGYTINYELNGGTLGEGVTNPESYTIESAAITLANPTREGYDFVGWTGTGLDAATITVTIPAGSTGNRSYTATWTPTVYTIGCNLKGGALATENPQTYTIESDPITLVNPTKEGYDFAGWTGTDLEEATAEVTIPTGSTGNRTYTATWTAVEYAITYDLKGGAVASENPQTYTIESDPITLTNPTKEGYDFAGWTGTGLSAATVNVTIPTGNTGDRSYTATWTPTVYAIACDLKGGAVASENPQTYTIESDPITLTNPTKEGYNFAGWTGTDLDEATMAVTIPTGSIGDRAYTATWTAVEYTITYDLKGGTATNPETYTIETETFALSAPARDGYTFAGWIISEGDTPQTTMLVTKGSTGDKSFTATWNVVEYSIGYDLKGGTAENLTSYTTESDPITLNNPTKRGYDFAGWTGTGLEEATVEVTIPTGSTGNRAYTATWTPTEYAITYDLDGGDGENPKSYTIESDPIALTAPTKEGYDFAGWTGTGLTQATASVTIETGSIGERSYKATWTAVSYAIRYDLDGGDAENPANYTIETETFTLTAPTKAGYDFAGWTGTDLEEATIEVTIEQGSIGERSYKATWTIVDYTIGYELAGGALDEGVTNPTGYTVESDPITLANPTKAAYDFAGWTGTGLDAATVEVTIPTGSTGNRTYTATWTPTEYEITYDLDGGDAVNPAVYTIETETFTLNNPTKGGYVFLGWTGDNGDEPQAIVTIEQGSTGEKHFTANWSTDGYAITYDLDGGDATNPGEYTIETPTFKLNNPTKTGYTFTGWTGTGLTEQTMDVIIDKGSSGARAYTAHWTPNVYFVDFRSNTDADESFTMEYTYDSTYPTPENTFTKTGASFQGWSATGNGEALAEIFNLTAQNNEHVQLFAIWADVEYTLSFDLNGATSGTADDMSVTYSKTVTLPDGADLVLFSDDNEESRTFLGWTADGTDYEPGAEFICPDSDVTFTAIWSANYYALDKLVETIDGYRENDAVPANDNDPQYKAGGSIAATLGSDGLYAWDNYDMTAVEAALADAKAAENRDLPVDLQSRVNALKNVLQQALDAITLANADYDAMIDCTFAGEGFYDEHTGKYYPLCEENDQHSYNSLLAVVDAIFAADNADLLYTAESVEALHDDIYGNGFDKTGIVPQVQNANFKAPAQGMLDEFVSSMAQTYHTTLELKAADYTALDKLITEYLPSLHNDVVIGQGVKYSNIESFYTADSVADLKDYYENIERNHNIVEQWMLEEGGDIYDALKDLIDALVPVDADYMNVFYEILSIPTGTEGFSYPAPDATRPMLPTWMEWARDNADDIASQMDTAYLEVRYTETSVANLYRVLNSIQWNKSIFEQDLVDGSDNVTSYKALLNSAISGLRLRAYTITFKYNDGTDASFTTQDGYNYSDRIDHFPTTNPQRDGFVFKGWTDDPESTEPVSVEDCVFADMTLYAIWGSVEDEPVDLVAAEGSTTVIDEQTGFIYGLAFNLTRDKLESDYLEVVGNGHLEYDRIDVGTGTVVTLINDYTNEAVKSYTLIVFGDVNGDGAIGPDDVTKVRTLAARLGDDESAWALTNPYAFAANVFEDEQINQTDVGIIRALAGRVNGIDQVTRQTYVLN